MRLGILVAAVVLTAGCGGGSGDEPGSTEPGSVTPGPGPTPGPVESTSPIAFSAQQQDEQDVTRAGQSGEGVTRAATPLNDKVSSFKVWGLKNIGDAVQTVFPGYTVNYVSAAHSTTTNSDGWEYVNQGPDEQTIKYWDWSVTAYRFFGVTGELDGAYEPNEANKETYVIKIPADATNVASTPYYSHLWYSTGVLPEYSSRQFGQPVQLEFVQPISKVRFMYKYVTPREGVSLAYQRFRPTDESEIFCKGTVTVTYPLTGTETREWFTTASDGTKDRDDFTIDCESDPTNYPKSYPDDVPGGWYTVLPNAAQGSYTLSVDINGSPKSATVPAEFMHWQPGYSYTYVFKINAEGGVEIGWVEYAVTTPWKTGESGTWTVYNW